MAKAPYSLDEVLGNLDWNEIRRYRGLILGIPIFLIILTAIYTSYYTVQPEEEAVVKRFGKVIGIKEPGLHFKLPFGIDTATPVPIQRVLKEEFGFRSVGIDERTQYQKNAIHRAESLMLTGDLKVIDVEWVVQFTIADPNKYLHMSRNPPQTLRDISEAVMRRIVGNSLGSDVLTEKRVEVSTTARAELQQILDSFDIGINVNRIELQDVTPPELVKPAFNEVNQSEQDRETLINEAEKRRNQVIPRAEGQAKQVIAEAEGYAAERVNRSRGEAERFTAILNEYRNAPEVTRKRMYLEMIDTVLQKAGRIYVMEENANSPLPVLNLDTAPASPRDNIPAASTQTGN